MGLKKALFNIKGMTRDLAASKFSPEFAYENKNMRLVATDHNNSSILTNEKGNLKVSSGAFSSGISGTPIGQAILNDSLILFTTGGAPEAVVINSIYSSLPSYQSFKRYSSYTNAMSDTNGTNFSSDYSVGDYNYFYGLAGEYVGYTDTDGKRKVLSPIYGGIPVLVMNVDVDDDALYYVSQYVEDAEFPDFGGNSLYFQLNTNADPSSSDKIYKMSFNSGGTLVGSLLYSGSLGFNPSYPIETITVFENEKIQKVYWTDGINQPRVINIAEENPSWGDNSFNFVRNVTYGGNISISKNQISFGSFAPGVIQYCFTYFDLYGTETNIFYTSPLYYVSPATRGGNPEETVSCSFTISIPTYDTSFDYLRIYSILRTSINATPQVRKVVDISLKGASGTIKYTDTGVDGETLDPTSLLFIGGEPIFAGTIAQKDNTLFLGDITLDREPLSTTVKTEARTLTVSVSAKTISLPDDANVGNYSYTSQLDKNNSQITYFRRGETYRLGFQAQHYTGKWSDVVFIKDYEVTNPITTSTGSVSVNNIRVDINSTIKNRLTLDGYVKVRPVVVFPDADDRTIICEGVCCPTVYNVEDRYNNAPYAQASWFFRPNSNISSPSNGTYLRYLEFRHNYPIPSNRDANAEIQCISNAPPTPALRVSNNGYTEKSSGDSWVSENRECFYIDQSIFTFHSPDIEFDETLKNFEVDNSVNNTIGFRIVGYVPINASYSDIDIEASTPANYAKGKYNGEYQFKASVAPGFIKKTISATTAQSGAGWKSLVAGCFWLDDFSDSINENYLGDYPVAFAIYPWHKSGAINGATRDAANSILKHKAMSIFRFSRNNGMLSASAISAWGSPTISGAVRFDSDELSMVKIPAQSSSSSSRVYYGNIDKIVTIHGQPKGKYALRDYDGSALTDSSGVTSESYITRLPGAYPIAIGSNTVSMTALEDPDHYDSNTDPPAREPGNVRVQVISYNDAVGLMFRCTDQLYTDTDDDNKVKYKRFIYNDTKTISTDPVSIKYKSTPHLVIALKDGTNSQTILPRCTNGATTTTSYSYGLFWDSSLTSVTQGQISVSPGTGYLWLGELYRKDISSSTRFGGTSDEAIENNKWVVAGEPVSLSDSTVTLLWTQGDTYYQRYDCLKTYPFTNEDTNSVSDTLSFMCETRVNIDGRYDRNRGQLSTLYVTRANQNLVNMAYSQQNNYFTYRGFNASKVNSTVFPNTITWSKTKSMGEEVDTWTNITLASTLDVDGDKGKVQALRRYNNDILCFQDRGISQILYNENVQIASTTGVPIEIANSGKVSGKRYISNHIGCTNKWSICSSPNGLYFVDSLSSDIYLFNSQFNSLSDTLGFHSWTVNNLSNTNPWNPYDFNGCVTYYDKTTGDVMFITADTCLTFSEPIGHFSSFYDYGSTPFFSNIKNRGIAFHKDSSNNKYYPYLHREGEYNNFFGTYKPFWTVVVANPDPTEDKVFNNLEYRGDTFQYNSLSGLWDYKYDNTFDYLETWNEYQKGTANLADIQDKPANLKKKFRVWRANIPRNTTNQGGDTLHRYTRDRMRNPWLYIKLAKTTSNNYRTELHDLVVNYFE